MEDIGATDTIESLTRPTVEQTAAMEDIGAIENIPVDTGVDYSEFDDLEADIGAQPIEGLDTEPSLIDISKDKINDIGQSISDALGTTYDALNTTIDIAGKKINLASTAAKAVLNKYIGGPISLVIDALGAMDLPGGPTLQTSKAESIGLAAPGQTQDKYGINTQSAFGDYDKYNIDRVEELEGIVADQKSRDLTNTLQMKELEDRNEYNTISGVGGDVEGDQPGMTIAEELGLMDKIDPGLRVGQKEDIVDAPVDIVDVQAVEEAIERAEAMEAAKIAEIDRQNRVREAEAAEAERARRQAAHNAMIREQQASVHGGDGAPVGARAGSWGPWVSKGGLIRKPYGKGGIVDLLK